MKDCLSALVVICAVANALCEKSWRETMGKINGEEQNLRLVILYKNEEGILKAFGIDKGSAGHGSSGEVFPAW
jgi:hypothetical protein